jgi:hypothetical protein
MIISAVYRIGRINTFSAAKYAKSRRIYQEYLC